MTSSRTRPKAILMSSPGSKMCFISAVVNGLFGPALLEEMSIAGEPALAA
jgi:hypothetical protein